MQLRRSFRRDGDSQIKKWRQNKTRTAMAQTRDEQPAGPKSIRWTKGNYKQNLKFFSFSPSLPVHSFIYFNWTVCLTHQETWVLRQNFQNCQTAMSPNSVCKILKGFGLYDISNVLWAEAQLRSQTNQLNQCINWRFFAIYPMGW